MLLLHFFLGLGLWAHTPSSSLAVTNPLATAAGTYCGDSTQFSRRRVAGLLNAARTISAPNTRLAELANVQASSLVLLTDASGATICQQLRTKALANRDPDTVTGKPWVVSVYNASGYYFAVVSRSSGPGSGQVVIGGQGGTIVVYDSALNQVLEANG
jgi:hypothetical protein